jgi:hypothetical protein
VGSNERLLHHLRWPPSLRVGYADTAATMKRHAFCIVTMSILLSHHVRAVSVPDRSVSPSRQFILYGADARLRGAVSELAENTKENLLGLLRQPDAWRTAIIVNLQLPQTIRPEMPPAVLRFSQTGFGLKLQLDLTIASELDPARIESELMRAILLEMTYRNQPTVAAGTPYVPPPDWLIEGTLALTPGRDRAALMETLQLATQIMALDEFLRQRPALLDSPGRVLYRAYSLALVQLLLDSPDGRARFVRYIDNLSRASNDPLADLKAQFPFLSENPQRLWQTRIADLSSSRSYQLLGFAETDKRLDETLHSAHSVAAGASKPLRLEDLVQRKALPAEKIALRKLGEDLLLVIARAHPAMRPVVQEYYDISALLARGKRKRLAARLARLETTRSSLIARMNQIDDYMNWFEATQQTNTSGTFIDYLRSAGESTEPQPRRRDPISVYLDVIEQQVQN